MWAGKMSGHSGARSDAATATAAAYPPGLDRGRGSPVRQVQEEEEEGEEFARGENAAEEKEGKC